MKVSAIIILLKAVTTNVNWINGATIFYINQRMASVKNKIHGQEANKFIGRVHFITNHLIFQHASHPSAVITQRL